MCKVVVIEDDDAFAEFITQKLSEHVVERMVDVPSSEVLADVVILDLELNMTTGQETINKLNTDARVIAISNNTENEVRRSCSLAHVDDFVTKSELNKEVLNRMIRREYEQRSALHDSSLDRVASMLNDIRDIMHAG